MNHEVRLDHGEDAVVQRPPWYRIALGLLRKPRRIELLVLAWLNARDQRRFAKRIEDAPKPESTDTTELNGNSARTWPHPAEVYGDVFLEKVVYRFEVVTLIPKPTTPCDVKDMGQRLQVAMAEAPGHVVNYMTHTPGVTAGVVISDCGCDE